VAGWELGIYLELGEQLVIGTFDLALRRKEVLCLDSDELKVGWIAVFRPRRDLQVGFLGCRSRLFLAQSTPLAVFAAAAGDQNDFFRFVRDRGASPFAMSSKTFHKTGQSGETFTGEISPSSTSWTWRASALKIALIHSVCGCPLTCCTTCETGRWNGQPRESMINNGGRSSNLSNGSPCPSVDQIGIY
jgi:hypothetical protein